MNVSKHSKHHNESASAQARRDKRVCGRTIFQKERLVAVVAATNLI